MRASGDTPLRAVCRHQEYHRDASALDGHPFFVATLFQPERAALQARLPPLVAASAQAALA
jgi:CTP synthase (UTP-ammonia lyase)